MRSLALFALLAPFALVGIACEESSSSSSGGLGSPDSGFAIPDGSTQTPDATVPDAAVPDAAPRTGLGVTVVRAKAPVADVRVILHDATGAVTGDLKTDAAGTVAVATAPSMVTVIATKYEENYPITYLGVIEGDRLVVDLDVPGEPEPVGAYSVTLTGPVTDAAQIIVSASEYCTTSAEDTSAPVIVGLFPQCVGAQNALLARARDESYRSLAFSFAKGLATPAAGATAVLPALPAFSPGTSVALTTTNVPDVSTRAHLFALTGDRPYSLGEPSGDPTAGFTFPVPTGFADAYQASLEVYGDGLGVIVKREPATATSIAFDATTLLPSITNIVLPEVLTPRPRVTWTSSAPLTAADGGEVELIWYRGEASQLRWKLVVPPGTTEVTIPAMPADVPPMPTEDASLSVADIRFVEATQIADYAALKALPISVLAGDTYSYVLRALPSNGTLRVSALRND